MPPAPDWALGGRSLLLLRDESPRVAELSPTPFVNFAAGCAQVLLAVALVRASQQRAGRYLAAYLALQGAFYVTLPLNWLAGDPRAAQAIVNTAGVPSWLAPAALFLFAEEVAGIRRGPAARGALLAALLALPAALLLVELALPAPMVVWRGPGEIIPGPLYAALSAVGLMALGVLVYALALVTRSLRRETDPSAIPAWALLLAAFLVPAVYGAQLALFFPYPWFWAEALGLPAITLLPAEPGLQALVSVALALLPLAFLRGAATDRAREAGRLAVALGAVVSAVVGLGSIMGLADTAALRWVVVTLLITYGALRHGLLGARRVVSPAAELTLAAVAFGVLVILFTGTLARVTAEWLAVTAGFTLAAVSSALTLALSGPLTLGLTSAEPRYREERELGRGSSGRAVLALDRRLNRPVVLKRLPAGPGALREARAAARVNHPSLVAVYDVLEGPAGASLVLEYMPGGTLEDRLARGPLEPGEAKRLGLELCAGLEAVHAAGLVHGDVKASNVFFRADGRAALGDFGAARRAGGVEETMAALAKDPVAGSLAGAAPEVLRGKRPDARVDVYALGALLYRVLAGEAYIRFPPAFEDARAAVLRDPPRLPHPRVPPAWEPVLARALAKDRGKRFQSASDLREALVALPAL